MPLSHWLKNSPKHTFLLPLLSLLFFSPNPSGKRIRSTCISCLSCVKLSERRQSGWGLWSGHRELSPLAIQQAAMAQSEPGQGCLEKGWNPREFLWGQEDDRLRAMVKAFLSFWNDSEGPALTLGHQQDQVSRSSLGNPSSAFPSPAGLEPGRCRFKSCPCHFQAVCSWEEIEPQCPLL